MTDHTTHDPATTACPRCRTFASGRLHLLRNDEIEPAALAYPLTYPVDVDLARRQLAMGLGA
jgi:hypothetical protein